jgi:membrane glycosyltransferase
MQYLQLLNMPGLHTVSRCQLWLAIAMYVGSPAWLALIVLGLLRQMPIDMALFKVMLAITMTMSFAPKLATLVDVLLNPALRRDYGGTARVLISAALEVVFSMLMAPISAVSVSLFMLGLPFGREIGWTSQQRDAVGMSLLAATRRLWLHTLLGIGLGLAFWQVFAITVWLWAPFVVGLVGSIPLAVISADPRLGRLLTASGLCRIPEEARLPDQPEYTAFFSPFDSVTLTTATSSGNAE